MSRPVVSLLTDFGLRDPSAGICKGVILSIAPDAHVIDISHEVAKYAVRDGALLLWCALPWLPVGAHVGVVDPGVGTTRRPIAVRVARGDTLIGPDNGLLMPAAERLGGVVAAHELEEQAYRLQAVSASFHGRDIFSPAAAHVASGVPIEALGRRLASTDLVPLRFPEPRATDGGLETDVIYVDTFGNVKLGALTDDLCRVLGPLHPGDPIVLSSAAGAGPAPFVERTSWQDTFGRVAAGESLLYEDSYGRLCLADNMGNVARRLGIAEDLVISIRRA